MFRSQLGRTLQLLRIVQLEWEPNQQWTCWSKRHNQLFVNSRKCWYYNSLTDMHDSCRRATLMLWTEEATAASWKKCVKHVLQQQRATLFESEASDFRGGSKSLLLPDRLGRYSKVTDVEASGTSWFAVAPGAGRRQKKKRQSDRK